MKRVAKSVNVIITRMVGEKVNWLLLIIFLVAIVVRFLYFPNDISFTYDQARDAFIAREVVAGDLKIIGPPSTFEGIFHGPLYYYIVGPLYQLSNGNPELVSAFLRISNVLGIFLVFMIARNLFSQRIGLIAAMLFGLSFEQTQYAIFLGHPSLAVLAVLLFYLGLTLLFIKKERKGLIIALFGLGLSIQFHFSLIILFLPLSLLLFLLRKRIPLLGEKTLMKSLIVFSIATASYLLAEFNFNFRTIKSLVGFLLNRDGGAYLNMGNVIIVAQRFVHDNIFQAKSGWILLVLLLVLIYLFIKKKHRISSIILTTWLFGSLFIYLFDHSNLPPYQYSIAGSVSLVILTSYILNKLIQKQSMIGLLLLGLVISSNTHLIKNINPGGNIVEIIVQDGMLLSKQKEVLDYIYQKTSGDKFSIGAISNPFKVNTTWSYLFEWYGSEKYGYLPVWGGDYAEGFKGNMEIVNSRSKLPSKHFVIIEPTRGIYKPLISKMINEEDIFSEVLEEQSFGKFKIQFRQKKH